MSKASKLKLKAKKTELLIQADQALDDWDVTKAKKLMKQSKELKDEDDPDEDEE